MTRRAEEIRSVIDTKLQELTNCTVLNTEFCNELLQNNLLAKSDYEILDNLIVSSASKFC